jgi:hypothetical protein
MIELSSEPFGKFYLSELCVSVVNYFLPLAIGYPHSALSSWLLFLQIERGVVLYIIWVHQDTIDCLFFVFAGFAGLEELIGLFHR